MRGGRLWLTVAGLVVLAVLAIVAVAVGDGSDEDEGGGPSSSTTDAAAPADDRSIAATLLPPVGALGADWVETLRDDAPTEAAIAPGDTCPSGPIPEGWLIRGEQRRLDATSTVVEALAVTAGVVTEGASPADLDDPAVTTCLEDGLAAQASVGSTVAAVDGPDLGTPPRGAVVSHQRFEVTGPGGTGGTFDFVLVRRGRAVSLGLLTRVAGTDPVAATPLAEVVAALDGPLAAAQRLG